MKRSRLKRNSNLGRKGREAICENCGETFSADREHRTYKRRYCSSTCAGAGNRREKVAAYPPKEEVERLYVEEGLTDRELGARFGHSYQWALGVRRHYGIPGRASTVRGSRRKGEPPRWRHSNGYIVVDREYEHRLVAEQMLGRKLRPGEVVHHKDDNPANNDPSNLRVYESHAAHMKDAHPPKPKRKRTKADNSVHYHFRLGLKPEESCRNCGAPACDLHHAVPRSVCLAARTDLRNGLPLCRRCHQGWHHRKVTLYRDIFKPEEWEYVSSLELTGQRIEAWLDDHYPARPVDSFYVETTIPPGQTIAQYRAGREAA